MPYWSGAHLRYNDSKIKFPVMTLSLFRKIHMKAAFACCAFLIALPFSASHAGNIVHSGLPGAPVIVGTENRKPPETVSENNVPEAAVHQSIRTTQKHSFILG